MSGFVPLFMRFWIVSFQEGKNALDRLADGAAVHGFRRLAYISVSTSSILDKLKSELEKTMDNPDARVSDHYQASTLSTCLMVLKSSSKGRPTRVISPNTPTSMIVYLAHPLEEIFPNSMTYRPEQWIQNPRLDEYLFGFENGSRGCAGIDLAYAESYITIVRTLRSYGSADCRHQDDKECVGALMLLKV
ncbi:benzoate 4-monooxygenase cytochrome P450, putative [Talaromyces stipitatus ATCC 10500]|uniref:Benzoate 4-monooxygenase cytochrome P450, putative n=1 Tax=Talaromyces stipitatus (strain ATCC 10500 / CBS 375.48 / QM 6759 / NRRL 1006) TaxID=441959 RepID=B8MJB5_TALSN|nr:benzoate 4-monooxygenase cytochrome P450, putative [Talaromyces stipitatus ATCC 10500]EED14704.1 benzoate 4-monooxygenase cytochrome P450, putative [Talaromyces stipitatus ATCC 10500]